MSRTLAVAAVTLASIASSPARAADPGPPLLRPTVPLVWMDPAGVATGLELIARQEARSLLEKMGASVSWQREEAGGVARPGVVRVILLDRAASRGADTPILGATPPGFEVSPFVWVHVPNVRAAVGLPPRGSMASLDLGSTT